MNKVLEGMARAAWEFDDNEGCYDHLVQGDKTMRMAEQKAALLWLASNVSDEMVAAFSKCLDIAAQYNITEQRKYAISAALRAAAGGGDK